MTSPKLVVLDDEKDLAGFVCDVAELSGFSTQSFNRADAFKSNFRDDADVIVLDLLLPDIDGVEIIRFLAETGTKAQLILVSGFDDGVLHAAQNLVIEQGLPLIGSLSKPFRKNDLSSLLQKASTDTRQETSKKINYSLTTQDLKNAIANDFIKPYYQPKIHLLSKKVVGLEALVRWDHPDFGILLPDSFLTIAENSNLIDDITWVMLQKSVEQCQRWNHKNLKLTIAINVSASTMKDLSTPEKVSDLLHKHRVDSRQIMFEMTETALMTEFTKSLDILTRLRMKGFRLSIDDFGTGYSSLVQLHRAPFAELKIDKSFVSIMETDKEAYAIVETVIALAQKLDMQVVAEGVESESVLEILTSLACDMAQGFHISKPLSAEEITQWLKANPLRK